ncbi:MAG: sugar transporter permease [Firmicutes bacterium]|nr:sugar transporter permease [Bacillota bacterium]
MQARSRSPLRSAGWWGFAFAMPAILLFLAFSLWPILNTFYLSLFKYDLLTPKEWVGVRNFARLPADQVFLRSLKATAVYVLGTYIPVWGISLALAMALNAKIKLRGLLRTLYFIPPMMSMVVVSVIWKLMFHHDGLLNTMLMQPLLGHPVDWLTDERWAPVAIILMSIWKETGFYMVVFLAGLQSISSQLYEAARIDGAGGWALFRHITLPMLKPTFAFVTIISLIQGLQAFIPQWVMADGGPNGATTSIALLIYRMAFVWLKMGPAAAVAVILFVLVGAVTLIQWRLQRAAS